MIIIMIIGMLIIIRRKVCKIKNMIMMIMLAMTDNILR